MKSSVFNIGYITDEEKESIDGYAFVHGTGGVSEAGIWQPEGVPTVYNFINSAAHKVRLEPVILTCKDSG